MENSRVKWNKDTIYALGLFKHLTTVLGFWPKNDRKTSAIRITIITIILLSLVIVFVKNIFIYGNCGSTIDFVDVLTLITTSVVSIAKIVIPWFHRNSLRRIVNSAVKDWSHIDDDYSRDLMLQYAYAGRVVLFIQLFGAYMSILPRMVARLPGIFPVSNTLENDSLLLRNIPIGPSCWVSVTMNQYLYFAYYFYVCFHLIILASSYLGGDAFTFGIAMHVCCQFELLYRSVNNINSYENVVQQRKLVKKFTKRHSDLLEFSSDFETACNVTVFIEVAANSGLICLSGVILIWALQVIDGEIIFAMLIRIFTMYVQLFIYSYIGEVLSNQAEKLQDAIYDCNWYTMSRYITKDLNFIMMRTNKIFYLTAGKIYVMNFSNFKNLVKSMASMLSMFRLMLEK